MTWAYSNHRAILEFLTFRLKTLEKVNIFYTHFLLVIGHKEPRTKTLPYSSSTPQESALCSSLRLSVSVRNRSSFCTAECFWKCIQRTVFYHLILPQQPLPNFPIVCAILLHLKCETILTFTHDWDVNGWKEVTCDFNTIWMRIYSISNEHVKLWR